MKLRYIVVLSCIFAGFFYLGWVGGRNSVQVSAPDTIAGTVTAEEVEKGMTEVAPDTIFLLQTRIIRDTFTVEKIETVRVPVTDIAPGSELDAATAATLKDWNTLRKYEGVLFDDTKTGKITYEFPVQFNRAGAINYTFVPAPVPEQKTRRMRFSVEYDHYSNGLKAYGLGAQQGFFGARISALRLEADKYAFGVGFRIIF